jgi:hypothetical protein
MSNDTITLRPIVGRYEKVNPARPGDDFRDLVIYVVATSKGTVRAVTSGGPLARYDRTSGEWSREARLGDLMEITLDTFGAGHRRIGDWCGDLIVGIVTVDKDGNVTSTGSVPTRKVPRYFCD